MTDTHRMEIGDSLLSLIAPPGSFHFHGVGSMDDSPSGHRWPRLDARRADRMYDSAATPSDHARHNRQIAEKRTAHAYWRDVAIVAIKAVHYGIFLLNAASVLHIFWVGVLNRRSRWRRLALVAALTESFIFVANRGLDDVEIPTTAESDITHPGVHLSFDTGERQQSGGRGTNQDVAAVPSSPLCSLAL